MKSFNDQPPEKGQRVDRVTASAGKNPQELRTMQWVYQMICLGEDPWTALSGFTHDFFRWRLVPSRQKLLDNPIDVPGQPTPEQIQWAAFCAAAVEYLAPRYDLVCPEWAQDPCYILPEPWYPSEEEHWDSSVREHYEASTPRAFRQRNVFCGLRVFMNKYITSREPYNREHRRLFQQMQAEYAHDPEGLARATEGLQQPDLLFPDSSYLLADEDQE